MRIDDLFQDLALESQGRATLLANGLAVATDKVVHGRWNRFLREMMGDPDGAARLITDGLSDRLFTLIRDRLRATAIDAWNDRMRFVWETVPRPLLGYLARRSTRPARETWAGGGLALGFQRIGGLAIVSHAYLVERESTFFGVGKDVPGEFQALFQPPTPQQVDAAIQATVGGKTWAERLTRHTEADKIGAEIRSGILSGESREAIARRILPLVEKDRVAANRIARTETHRITVRMQMDATTQSIGGAQKGWRYVATLDDRTRPEHAALDQRVYALGDGEMPELPSGPNCRCVYGPVMQSLEDLGLPKEVSDLFNPTERAQWRGGSALTGGTPGVRRGRLDYGSWFNDQPAKVRRRIVGAGNYNTLLGQRRGPVKWSDALQTFGLRLPDTSALSTQRIFALSPPPPAPPPIPPPLPPPPPPVPTPPAPAPQPGTPKAASPKRPRSKPVPAAQEVPNGEAVFQQARRSFDQRQSRLLRLKGRYLNAGDQERLARVTDLYNSMYQREAKVIHRTLRLPKELRSTMTPAWNGAPSVFDGMTTVAKKTGHAKGMDNASDFLSSITSKSVVKDELRVDWVSAKGGRAFFSTDPLDKAGRIYLTGTEVTVTSIHEMGHAIELGNDAIGDQARKYLKRRTAGEKAQSLAKAVPGGGHAPSEMFKEGGFIDPYWGRIYPGGETEIVSMGVETLFMNPRKLMNEDPESFKWLVNLLRGTK